MYCTKCGTQLSDDARFCYGCGTPTNSSAPTGTAGAQPRYENAATPKKPPKKKKRGILAIVAIVAAVVLVGVAVAALAFSGLFGSDSVKVAAALAKSGEAFSDAVDQMELTDLSSLTESKKVSEDISVWIDEIDGSSTMKGMGIRLSADSNLPGRNVGMAVTPFFGSADLLSVQMKLEDSEVYVGSPELTGGKFYMINTQTFCQDLENMGADMGEAAGISFNIFDIIEKAEKLYGKNDDLTKEIKQAAIELAKSAEVEKSGSETIAVNGQNLKCTAYDVLITENSMYKFVTTLEDAYLNAQNPGGLGELLESMGLPAEVVEEMEYTLEGSSTDITDAFSDIYYVVEQLGDIQLALYLHDGYVVAAVYEKNFDGTDVAMILNIGGGKNYVDDISLRLIAEDEEYRIGSSGNHAGTNDVFTDETVVEYVYNGDGYTLATLNTTYAPKQKSDNFNFKMDMDSVAVQLRGQLTCDEEFMNLNLNKITVSEYGEALAVLGMELRIGKYEGDSFSVMNYQALADMTQDDLIYAVEEIAEYASDWAINLDSTLQDMLTDIAYEFF